MCRRIIGVFGRTVGNILPFCLISCLAEQKVGGQEGDDGGAAASLAYSVEKLERSRYYQYTYLHNFSKFKPKSTYALCDCA